MFVQTRYEEAKAIYAKIGVDIYMRNHTKSGGMKLKQWRIIRKMY